MQDKLEDDEFTIDKGRTIVWHNGMYLPKQEEAASLTVRI